MIRVSLSLSEAELELLVAAARNLSYDTFSKSTRKVAEGLVDTLEGALEQYHERVAVATDEIEFRAKMRRYHFNRKQDDLVLQLKAATQGVEA